mmetsp:Transcript_49336/g.130796  ORF Transcript_49336/g.130796 Transcript_49336/m.130796 type:complete len:203 (-) Transcript_49336:48-656(-)
MLAPMGTWVLPMSPKHLGPAERSDDLSRLTGVPPRTSARRSAWPRLRGAEVWSIGVTTAAVTTKLRLVYTRSLMTLTTMTWALATGASQLRSTKRSCVVRKRSWPGRASPQTHHLHGQRPLHPAPRDVRWLRTRAPLQGSRLANAAGPRLRASSRPPQCCILEWAVLSGLWPQGLQERDSGGLCFPSSREGGEFFFSDSCVE